MPQKTFFVVNLIAAIVWGCLFSAIGYAFGNVIATTLGRIGLPRLLLIAGAALVVVVGGVWLWRRRNAWDSR